MSNELSRFERLLSWIVGLSRVKYALLALFMGIVWLFIQGTISLIGELVSDGFDRYTYVDAFGSVLIDFSSGNVLISIILITLFVSMLGRGVYRYSGHGGYRRFKLFIISLIILVLVPYVLSIVWSSDMGFAISMIVLNLSIVVLFVFSFTIFWEHSEVGDYDRVLRTRDVFKLVFVVTSIYSGLGAVNYVFDIEFPNLLVSLYLEYIYACVVLYVVYRWRNVVVRVNTCMEHVEDSVMLGADVYNTEEVIDLDSKESAVKESDNK